MDWANERYVRVYTRDTTTMLRLGWEGRSVFFHLLRAVDRSGVLDIGDMEPWEAAMIHFGFPEALARTGMERCMELSTVVHNGMSLALPNYLEAQETRKTDAQRQRESRQRRRQAAVTECDGSVTKRDEMVSQNVTDPSHSVTPSHAQSQPVTPSLAVPSLAVPSLAVPSLAVPSSLRRDKRAARGAGASAVSKSGPAWDAYSSAYEGRYGTPAVRNAKVNRQLCQLVDRVGAEAAPAVAAAYVAHNDPWYARKGHPVGSLLQDAEKLHTEWARGRPITRGDARESSRADEMRAQSERVQALIDARSGNESA